jgi:hypothetical protein
MANTQVTVHWLGFDTAHFVDHRRLHFHSDGTSPGRRWWDKGMTSIMYLSCKERGQSERTGAEGEDTRPSSNYQPIDRSVYIIEIQKSEGQEMTSQPETDVVITSRWSGLYPSRLTCNMTASVEWPDRNTEPLRETPTPVSLHHTNYEPKTTMYGI